MTPSSIVRYLLEDGPTIRGEYWIVNGDVMFADGDVGDMNHEAYAVDHAAREIAEIFGGDINSDMASSEELEEIVLEFFREEKGEEVSDWYSAAKDYLSGSPDREKLLATLEVSVGGGDPREVAMRYWGWKWCRGSNIGTWTFTSADRQSIVSGLDQITEQEYAEDDEDWESVGITIGVGSTGKRYYMTLAELRSGRVVSQDPTWGLR